MAGITANSVTQSMLSADTSEDNAVTGYIRNERITLATYPTGTSYAWSITKPGGSRSTISDEADHSPYVIPDRAGAYLVNVTVDGTTTYAILITVLTPSATSHVEAVRLQPQLDVQVPTPVVGTNIYDALGYGPSYKRSNGTIARLSADTGVNVKDYGATGDGSTDDTTAIQNAIDDSGASSGRKPVVLFPPGLYRITSTLEVHDKGSGVNTLMTLRGANSGAGKGAADYATAILWDGGDGTHGIEFHTRESAIENLAIICASGASLETAIDIDNSIEPGASRCTNNSFRNVFVIGYRSGYGSISTAFTIGSGGGEQCAFMSFDGCKASGLSRTFVWIDNDTAQAMMHRLVNCESLWVEGVAEPQSFVEIRSGSFSALNCSTKGCSSAAFVIGSDEKRQTISIENLQLESCARLLVDDERGTPLLASPIIFRGGRISCADTLASDGEFVQMYSRSSLVLDGVLFQDSFVATDPDTFRIRCANDQSSVRATSCVFPTATPFDVGGKLYVQGCLHGDAGAFGELTDYIATGIEPDGTTWDGATDVESITDLDARWTASGLSGAQATVADTALAGNGYTLTSSGTTMAATVGGLDALVFDTTNFLYDASAGDDLATDIYAAGANDWTFYARFRWTDSGIYTLAAWANDANNGYNRIYSASGKVRHSVVDDDGDVSQDSGVIDVATGQDQTLILRWDATAKLATLYVDGEIRTVDPRSYTDVNEPTISAFSIGALLRAAPHSLAKMAIREAGLFSRQLTGQEMRKLNFILQDIWS